jgi:hypothetical protein
VTSTLKAIAVGDREGEAVGGTVGDGGTTPNVWCEYRLIAERVVNCESRIRRNAVCDHRNVAVVKISARGGERSDSTFVAVNKGSIDVISLSFQPK